MGQTQHTYDAFYTHMKLDVNTGGLMSYKNEKGGTQNDFIFSCEHDNAASNKSYFFFFFFFRRAYAW